METEAITIAPNPGKGFFEIRRNATSSAALVISVTDASGRLLLQQQHQPAQELIVVDLAEYGTEDRLARALFDRPDVAAWRAGTGQLCVVLDSLDECQDRLSHVATVLSLEFARWPTERLFLRICETVGFAHAQGVVHRDLKPSNIMVGSFGEVLVLDWGIARLVRGEPANEGGLETATAARSPEDTAPGTILGTPGFMAPEQAQGWQHLVDARSDIYALGAILRVLMQRATGGEAPRPLRSICGRAAAADPADRYPAAAELAADVTRFLDGEPVRAHRETPAERAGRLFRKYQTAIVLVLTYLVIRFLFLAARGL